MKYAENNAMKRGEGLEDTLPISLICDFIFCQRRAWLEIQGEKIESLQMERGFHDIVQWMTPTVAAGILTIGQLM